LIDYESKFRGKSLPEIKKIIQLELEQLTAKYTQGDIKSKN